MFCFALLSPLILRRALKKMHLAILNRFLVSDPSGRAMVYQWGGPEDETVICCHGDKSDQSWKALECFHATGCANANVTTLFISLFFYK